MTDWMESHRLKMNNSNISSVYPHTSKCHCTKVILHTDKCFDSDIALFDWNISYFSCIISEDKIAIFKFFETKIRYNGQLSLCRMTIMRVVPSVFRMTDDIIHTNLFRLKTQITKAMSFNWRLSSEKPFNTANHMACYKTIRNKEKNKWYLICKIKTVNCLFKSC